MTAVDAYGAKLLEDGQAVAAAAGAVAAPGRFPQEAAAAAVVAVERHGSSGRGHCYHQAVMIGTDVAWLVFSEGR